MSILAPGTFFRKVSSSVEDPEGARFGDVTPLIADGVVSILEAAAMSEIEQRIGSRRYERGNDNRTDYRNGNRSRVVQTRLGSLSIRIPRLRSQGYVPSFLIPGQRALSEVDGWVASAFLCGMSRIQICRHLERLTGLQPSISVLDRVQKRLDECAKLFKERALTERYEYLFLDAAWVKDIAGGNAVRVCILTAVGITAEGRKEILSFERTARESESTWRGFLTRLKERGLNPATLALVISDEHQGLVNAVHEVLGDVAHQLCWAHRIRNAVERIGKADRKSFVEDIRHVYRAKNRRAALAAWAALRARWHAKHPSLIESIEEDMRSLLAFFDRPPAHHSYIRTSNPIERVFRDLRKRGYGCGAFTDRKSCDRILYSVYQLLNDIWGQRSIWQERARLSARAARPLP